MMFNFGGGNNGGGLGSQNRVFRNVVRSTRHASMDVLRNMAPSLNNTIEDNAKFMKEIYQVKKDKINDGKIKETYIYKTTEEMIKNAIADLKSGNLYNTDRLEGKTAEIAKEMGLEFDLGEMDFSEDFVEDKSGKTKKETKNNITNVDNKKIIVSNVTDNRETVATLGKISNNVMRNNGIGFSVLNHTMNEMLTFQQDNTLQHYNEMSEQATNMNNTLANIENIVAGIGQLEMGRAKISEQNKNMDDLLSRQGFSMDFYKEKFSKYMEDRGASQVGSMAKGILGSIAANPLGMALTYGIQRMLPKGAISFIKSLNDVVGNMHLVLNAKMKNWADKGSFPFAEQIFDIFGVKTERKRRLELNYEKGKVHFDGITRRAIVNVIPSLLSKILASVSKDKVYQQELVYDYDNGSFTTKKAVRTEFKDEQERRSKNNVKMRRYKDEILDNNDKAGDDQYRNKLDNAFNRIIDNQILITDDIDLDEISDDKGIAKDVKKYFTSMRATERMKVQRNLLEALKEKNEVMGFIEGNESWHNAYDLNLKDKRFRDKDNEKTIQELISDVKMNVSTPEEIRDLILYGEYFDKTDDKANRALEKVVGKVLFNTKDQVFSSGANGINENLLSGTVNLVANIQNAIKHGDDVEEIVRESIESLRDGKEIKKIDYGRNNRNLIDSVQQDIDDVFNDEYLADDSQTSSTASVNNGSSSKILRRSSLKGSKFNFGSASNGILDSIRQNVLEIKEFLLNRQDPQSSAKRVEAGDNFYEDTLGLLETNNKLLTDISTKLEPVEGLSQNIKNIRDISIKFALSSKLKMPWKRRNGNGNDIEDIDIDNLELDDMDAPFYKRWLNKGKRIFNNGKSMASQKAKGFMSFLTKPLDIIKGSISGLTNKITGKLDNVKDFMGKSITKGREILSSVLTKGKSFLSKTVEKTTEVFGKMASGIGKVGSRLLEFSEKALPHVLDFAGNVLNKSIDVATMLGAKVASGAKWAGGKAIQGIKWTGTKAKQGFQWAKSKISGFGIGGGRTESEHTGKNNHVFISGGHLDKIINTVPVSIKLSNDEIRRKKLDDETKENDEERLENEETANDKKGKNSARIESIQNAIKERNAQILGFMKDLITPALGAAGGALAGLAGGLGSKIFGGRFGRKRGNTVTTQQGDFRVRGTRSRNGNANGTGRAKRKGLFGKISGGLGNMLSRPEEATPVYVVGGSLDGGGVGGMASGLLGGGDGLNPADLLGGGEGRNNTRSGRHGRNANQPNTRMGRRQARGGRLAGRLGGRGLATAGAVGGLGAASTLGATSVGATTAGATSAIASGAGATAGAGAGVAKGAGMLGKLGKFGKFIPGIGAGLAIADGAYSAFDGWGSAGDVFKTADPTLGQKMSSATGGVLSSLTLGLVGQDTIAKGLHGAGSLVTDTVSSIGSGIWNGVKNIGSAIGDGISGMASSIGSGLSSAGSALYKLSPMSMLDNLTDKAKDFLNGQDGKKAMDDPEKVANFAFNMSPFGLVYNLGDKAKGFFKKKDGETESIWDKLFGKKEDSNGNKSGGFLGNMFGSGISGGIFGSLLKKIFTGSKDKASAESGGSSSGGTSGGSGKSQLEWPVPGHTKTSSPFSNRTNPVTGKNENHKGVDIPAPTGTPIVAAEAGTVVISRVVNGYGNYVRIKHNDGLETGYGHCSQLIAKEGEQVTRGQKIALVGSTGQSTGPHCHFEVIKDGTHVDPMPYITGGGSGSAAQGIYRLSALEEVGSAMGDPGGITNSAGDHGGKSYGTPQFSLNMGSLASFVDSLKTRKPEYYEKLSAHKLGSSGFDQAWKELAKNNKEEFDQIQNDTIVQGSYAQGIAKIKSRTGLDVNSRSKTIQSVAYSTVVQHGAGGAGTVWANALGSNAGSMDDATIINKVYDERGAGNGSKYFPSSSGAIQRGVAKRFQREKQNALKMLQSEKSGGDFNGPIMGQGGGEEADAEVEKLMVEMGLKQSVFNSPPSQYENGTMMTPMDTISMASGNLLESTQAISKIANVNNGNNSARMDKFIEMQKLLQDLVAVNKDTNTQAVKGNDLLSKVVDLLSGINESSEKVKVNTSSSRNDIGSSFGLESLGLVENIARGN